MNSDNYCRELESYLCRKNDGHLIRIVGPAFERVSAWARQGIPVTVACAGIDRYFERYYRRGPRRRPVRIEFCEADVLDAFDAWRRAVGVARAGEEPARSRSSLASHVERAIARLTALRASSQRAHAFTAALDDAARELDRWQASARTARGNAREELIEALAALDKSLIDTVLSSMSEAEQRAAAAAADDQLAPFRERMNPDAYEAARRAAMTQHVREKIGLPSIAFA